MAQPNCVEESQCRSQLMRVEVSNSILNNNAEAILPALQNFADSPTLHSLFEKSYDLLPISFPQNAESCQREKNSNNPAFANIKCNESGLCGKTLTPEVRDLICFKLPCPMFEGTLHVGACKDELSIFPNQISFPGPITIKKLDIKPTSVSFTGNKARLCFRINQLDLNMSVRLGLDTKKTSLPDNGINLTNVSPTLDGPRDICMSANVNFASSNPVSDLVLEPQGNSPFISDNMIRTASRQLNISGLSGYPADQLDRIKGELIPVIVQPLRESVEGAVKSGLSGVFQTELNRLATQATGSTSHLVNSSNLSTELGLSNLAVRNQMAITECAALHAAHRPIPPTHACIGIPVFGTPIDTNWGSPLINELMGLKDTFGNLPVTSESIKQRLIALKEVVRAQVDEYARPDDPPHFHQGFVDNVERTIAEYIDPLIDQISKNQLNSQIFNFVEIQNQLQGGAYRNVGVSIPDICSDKYPSPHARREMKNCPVQAYVDLNEMNQVFDKLWRAGRICQQGRGPFVPTLENGQPKYDPQGKPVGSGCYMELEGMSCYLNSAPQIKYDAKTKKYKTSVNLKSCFRGPAIFGLGKFGGDFNIDFAFTPKACNGGDFCMDKPAVNWKVVPGSERFSLKPDSFLHDIVTSKIQDAVNGAISDTIRIPMTSNVGPLATVPLEAEGRVDTGPGFFGACFRLRGSGASGQ
ncbi:MAG: hypothetical protein ACJ76H_16790 [Bacteriovoracaceae bacterium]